MRILLFGPLPPPIHGQSLAFNSVCNHYKNTDYRVIDINFTNQTALKKVFSGLRILKDTFVGVWGFKPTIIYMTCSRSLSGSFRDLSLLYLAKWAGIPVINHLHGADFKKFYQTCTPLYRWLLFNAYKAVKVNFVLTDRMSEQFSMFPHSEIVTIHNYYSSDFPERNKLPEQKKRVESISLCYMSNVMSTKGIFVLLEAFKKIQKESPEIPISLSVAGAFVSDSEMTAEDTKHRFMNYVHELPNLTYLGLVKGEEKFNLLIESDIFILPSYYVSEAVPLSIIEAMRSGCAIIATNYNYLPDLVDQESGLLVDVKSIESLNEALVCLTQTPSRLNAMKNNNVIKAKTLYSEDKYLHDIDKVLMKHSL